MSIKMVPGRDLNLTPEAKPEGECVPLSAAVTVPTVSPAFSQVAHLLEKCPPTRRPNRTGPRSDRDLEDELRAWEAASDEAFENMERDMTG